MAVAAVTKTETTHEVGGSHEQFSSDIVIHAIQVAHGIAQGAAEFLSRNFEHCTRRTIYNYINKYPEVAEVFNEERQRNVDFAENKQLEALRNGERWAIENWLFCSKEGRERGWLKRAEAARDEGLLNAIQIVIPDNTRDAGMIDVDVQTVDAGDDGDGRPSAAMRHQQRIKGLWNVEAVGLPPD